MTQMMGASLDIHPSLFTLEALESALVALRSQDVPGHAEMDIAFDPDTRRDGKSIGAMWRVRARWGVGQ